MWASQYWKFRHPYTWVNSGGLGTMGFSVPAAIGAKVGRPDRMVWAVDGDGCFQMTAQELVTAAAERIPVKVAILNNAYLGMVRQWQEMFYEERYSEVYLSPDLPDYVKWAEAMGCVGIRVESPEEIQPAIDKANEIDDRPVVIEFRTDSSREGLPDGRRRASPTARSRSPPVPGSTVAVDERRPSRASRTTPCRSWSRTRPACWPGSSNLFARRGYNIYSLAVAPTDDERFSRITVVVDVESAPLEQIVKQLHKLINVVKISELDPRTLGRARAAARHRQGRPGDRAARSSSWCRSSRAGSSPSATTSSPCRSRVIRPRWTTSRSFCDPSGSSSCSGRAEWPFRHWSGGIPPAQRERQGVLTMANVYYEKDADRSVSNTSTRYRST